MVKQEVLAALDAARGRYISGQELAAQLGVSRTAVWKAVAALRRDGIPIKAVTNRGYTLAQSVDVLNAAAVAVQLDEATVKALQIEVVDRLPGTNAALRSRADAGAREGLVLIAQAQSAGRGRGGHSFYSPPGGLYMSILLRPEIGARQAVGLTAMAAVAAAVQRGKGALNLKGKRIELLPKTANYILIYVSCVLMALVLIASMVIGTGVGEMVYYAVPAAWALIMAVYYTVKLM